MANTKIKEPYVNVSENIRETPNLLDIDGTANIGGVIVAPAGPRLSYVSGPKDFLKKYTVDGNIPRNADTTFINAYYLSFSAGLVLARSMNTQATSGLAICRATYNQYKLLMEFKSESIWGIGINDVFYFYNNGLESWVSFATAAKNITKGETHPYQAIIESLESSDRTPKVSVTSIEDLASKLSADTGKSVVYSSTTGGLISLDMQLNVLKVNNQDALVNLEVNALPSSSDPDEQDKVDAIKSVDITVKDGVILNYEYSLKIKFGQNGGVDGVKKPWAFTFGSMAYYHGPIDKSKYEGYSLVQCNSADDITNSINGIKGMSATGGWINNPVTTDTTKETADTEATDTEVTTDTDNTANTDPQLYEIVIKYSENNGLLTSNFDNVTIKETTPEKTTFDGCIFKIYAHTPQSRDCYAISILPDEGDLFQLVLDDNKSKQTFTVSLDPDALNQSGSNAYIENLNALGLEFTVEADGSNTNYTAPKSTQTITFGNSGLDLSQSKNTSNLINALYELEDQELYDIEYIAPLGIIDSQFIKNYVLIGKSCDWFSPVDIPYTMTNPNSINGYFLNIDQTSNVIGIGPFDKNTGLTGWLNYIAASTLYYTKVMNNRAQRKEFAPCFDITNGILDYTNPAYLFGKEDRTKLLNFRCPVNFVMFDQRSNVYYLNDNRTHQPETNIVSEEQNRRMVNKIKKDLKKLLKRFKGRFNTVTTRSDVRSLVNLYFSDNLYSQEYAPQSHEVICDETNNDENVIAANKLGVTVRVKLYNAVKFIDVLVDVFPLNVDFTA